MNGPSAPAAPVPTPGELVKLKATNLANPVSPVATIITTVAVILGSLLAGFSALHVGIQGTVPSSTGVASGAIVAGGAAFKYLDTHDKALAGVIQRDVAWGQAHAGAFDEIFTELQGVEALLPEHLQEKMASYEADIAQARQTATDALTQAQDAVEQASASAPVNVDQVASAVLAKISAATLVPPGPGPAQAATAGGQT